MSDEQIVEVRNDNDINDVAESTQVDIVTEDINIDNVIDNFPINTSSFVNQNGVQIENCLNDDELNVIRQEAKREAKSLNLNQEQAKQFCQDLYNSYNYSALVNKRNNQQQTAENETAWKERMEPAFGERESDKWNKNMDYIKRGADIAREYNTSINEDRLDSEIEALKNAGFSEVLKVIQAHNVLDAEVKKNQNAVRHEAFYGDIPHNPNLDDPKYNIQLACKRNREIFKDPNWRKDASKVREVSKNDRIINGMYY